MKIRFVTSRIFYNFMEVTDLLRQPDYLEKIDDNPMTVPYGDRSGVVIDILRFV